MALLPSATALFVAWAKSNSALTTLQGGRVATRLNTVLPATRVQRIGGTPESPLVDHPLLQVECWATDDVVAEQLARTYIEQLDTFRHRAASGRVYTYQFESGPFYSPDDPNLSNNARFIFTIRLITTT